jgi:hypothetical protein
VALALGKEARLRVPYKALSKEPDTGTR